MGERRAGRGGTLRTDRQIIGHVEDIVLLGEIAGGRVRVDRLNRMTLRRLAREDLCLAGFGDGVAATILPRGRRLLAVVRGELPMPLDD